MSIISKEEYQKYIKDIGPIKFNDPSIQWDCWYSQYSYYETMWDKYFNDHFLKELNSKNNEVSFINIVLWESCPGGLPFPHKNYAFDINRWGNLFKPQSDKYLNQVCNIFRKEIEIERATEQKLEEIIKRLCRSYILIIDIYPTHGISLDNNMREKLTSGSIFEKYSINKLKKIKVKINGKHINQKIYCSSEVYNKINNDSIKDKLKQTFELDKSIELIKI